MLCVTFGGQDSVQSEPDEALNELVNGNSKGSEANRSSPPVFHSGQGHDTDGCQNSAADKIRRR